MHSRLFSFWFALAGLCLCASRPAVAATGDMIFNWTYLVPENDTRDADVSEYDEYLTKAMCDDMNNIEKVFHHCLVWSKLPISKLLTSPTSFCELNFDAIKPFVLTKKEKIILREYAARGGFVLLNEDAYPYWQDEFWAMKSWPIVDFYTKELPALDPDFTVQRLTPQHALFRFLYTKTIGLDITHELAGNPNTPRLLLVSYRGHPCAFVTGQYTELYQGKWYALPRPFPRPFSQDPAGYEETVNIYVYSAMH